MNGLEFSFGVLVGAFIGAAFMWVAVDSKRAKVQRDKQLVDEYVAQPIQRPVFLSDSGFPAPLSPRLHERRPVLQVAPAVVEPVRTEVLADGYRAKHSADEPTGPISREDLDITQGLKRLMAGYYESSAAWVRGVSR